MGGAHGAGADGDRGRGDTSTPRTSSAAAVPTTSMIVSCEPTSWKCTCAGGRRWRRPSTSARAANVASARPATRSGRRASSSRPTMWACGTHDDVVVGIDHGPSRGHPGPEHRFGRRAPAAERAACSMSARTSSRSAPASRRLPSAMSPAMPAKQWNQAVAAGPAVAGRSPPS